jgi:hypothetical protein
MSITTRLLSPAPPLRRAGGGEGQEAPVRGLSDNESGREGGREGGASSMERRGSLGEAGNWCGSWGEQRMSWGSCGRDSVLTPYGTPPVNVAEGKGRQRHAFMCKMRDVLTCVDLPQLEEAGWKIWEAFDMMVILPFLPLFLGSLFCLSFVASLCCLSFNACAPASCAWVRSRCLLPVFLGPLCLYTRPVGLVGLCARVLCLRARVRAIPEGLVPGGSLKKTVGARRQGEEEGGRGGWREAGREGGREVPDDVGCGGRAGEQVMGVRDRNQLVPQQLDAQSAAVVDQLLDLVTRAPEEIDRELRYGRTSPSSSPSIVCSKDGDAWEAPAANEQVKSRVCHVCM